MRTRKNEACLWKFGAQNFRRKRVLISLPFRHTHPENDVGKPIRIERSAGGRAVLQEETVISLFSGGFLVERYLWEFSIFHIHTQTHVLSAFICVYVCELCVCLCVCGKRQIPRHTQRNARDARLIRDIEFSCTYFYLGSVLCRKIALRKFMKTSNTINVKRFWKTRSLKTTCNAI